jgi:hypothetical protein
MAWFADCEKSPKTGCFSQSAQAVSLNQGGVLFEAFEHLGFRDELLAQDAQQHDQPAGDEDRRVKSVCQIL